MPPNTSLKTLISRSVWTGSMMVVVALSGFVISLISARLLGPEGRGSYALVVLIITTSAFLANPGLYTASNYFFSSGKAQPSLIWSSVLLSGMLSALVAFLFCQLALVWFVHAPAFLAGELKLLVGAGAAACSLSNTMNGALYGLKRIRTVTIWTMASASLHALLVLLFPLVAPLSLTTFILAYIAFHGLDAGFKTCFVGAGQWRGILLRPLFLAPLIAYGLQVYLGRVFLMLSQRIDSFILYGFLGEEGLGYYSIAASFAEQLWMIPMAFSLVMLTTIAALPVEQKQATTLQTSQVLTLLEVLAALAIGFASLYLIPWLYGEVFRPAILPLILVLPGVVAFSSYYVIEPFFLSLGRPEIPLRIAFWGALSNLVLSLALISWLGLIGAALAYTLSYAAQLLLALYKFAGLSGAPFWAPLNVFQALRFGLQLGRQYWLKIEASR
jgi:O-antigen/teichoic acid export membrane protein